MGSRSSLGIWSYSDLGFATVLPLFSSFLVDCFFPFFFSSSFEFEAFDFHPAVVSFTRRLGFDCSVGRRAGPVEETEKV